MNLDAFDKYDSWNQTFNSSNPAVLAIWCNLS